MRLSYSFTISIIFKNIFGHKTVNSKDTNIYFWRFSNIFLNLKMNSFTWFAWIQQITLTWAPKCCFHGPDICVQRLELCSCVMKAGFLLIIQKTYYNKRNHSLHKQAAGNVLIEKIHKNISKCYFVLAPHVRLCTIFIQYSNRETLSLHV